MTTDVLSIDQTPANGDQPATQLVVIGPVGVPTVNPAEDADANWSIVIDVLRWKMKTKRAFMALVSSGGTDKDDNELYPFYAQMVRRWPYPYDPALIESYDEITVEEFNEVTRRVLAAFQPSV
jgi:hypothetical protein